MTVKQILIIQTTLATLNGEILLLQLVKAKTSSISEDIAVFLQCLITSVVTYFSHLHIP